tara:strand:- start:267 stop:3362 length:3096 start_codon:yes stop_codon:yes gene_type:complete
MKSKTSKSQFKRRKSALKKYQTTGSVGGIQTTGIQLGSNQYGGEDTALSGNYGLTPAQTSAMDTTPQGAPEKQSYADWSGMDTSGQVSTAMATAQGLGNIVGAATQDTKVDNSSGYYNQDTVKSLEKSNKGVRDSSIASTTGQTIMAASAYAGPFAWIPMVVGGLITAGGEIGKAVHKGNISDTSGNYADRMASRQRDKKHASMMKEKNKRFQDSNYFGSLGGTSFDQTSQDLTGKGLIGPSGTKGVYTPNLSNSGYKKGGLVKYQTGGSGVTRVYGDYHKDGGIAVPFGEVENKEVLDESPITQKILKDSKKDSGMYVFSEYLNTDGTKGYDDPDKTSIADARMAIENADISPEQKLELIAELMDNQEKGADRKAKFAKKNGGLMKYKTAGDVPEYNSDDVYPTNLEGTSEEIVYKRLRGKGLTDTAAKAVLANIIYESDGFKAQEEYSANNQGTKGYGVVQWTDTKNSKRRSMFDAYMKKNGLDPTLLENQVDYIVYEIDNHPENMPRGNSMNIETLNSIDNLEAAADYFMKGFEAPQNQSKRHLNKRLKTYNDSIKTSDLTYTGEPLKAKPQVQARAVNTDPVATSLNKWGTNPQGYTPEELQGFYEDAQEQDRLQIESEAAGNPTESTAFSGDSYDEAAGAFRPGMSAADKFYNKYSSAGADYVPASLEQITAQQAQASAPQSVAPPAQGGLPYPSGYTQEEMMGWYQGMVEQDEAQIAAEAAGDPDAGDYFDENTGTWNPDSIYPTAQKFMDKYNLQSSGGGMTPPPGTPPGGPSGPGGSTQMGPFVEGYGPSTDPNMYDAEGQMIGPVDFSAMDTGERLPFGPTGEEEPENPKKGGMSNRDIGRLAAVGGMTAAQLAMLASADTDYADPVSAYRRPRPLRVTAPRLRDTEYAAEVAERRYYDEELTKTTGPTGDRRRELRQEFDRGTERRQMGINKYNADAYQWEQGLNVQNLNEYYNQLANAQTLEESSRVSQSNAELMTELSKRQAMSQSIGNVSAGLMGYWGDEDLARASQINGTYDRYKRS